MKTFRKHWFDIGGFLSIICIGYIILNFKNFSDFQLILWFSLVSLFWHQLEEYRIAGTFPGMINTVMFKSNLPDRFPLNTNTTMLINVFLGWFIYFLAAIFAEKAIWLGIAAILISGGNIIAHTFLFNIKGRTFYNAGLVSCWLLFAPIIFYFFKIIFKENLATTQDWWIGIILGLILNYFGILKMIVWLSDKETKYIFEQRNLLKKDRIPL